MAFFKLLLHLNWTKKNQDPGPDIISLHSSHAYCCIILHAFIYSVMNMHVKELKNYFLYDRVVGIRNGSWLETKTVKSLLA